jgi:hypothetical protein
MSQSQNQFRKLLALLERLDEAKIPYQLRHSRDDALMVIAFAPGQYWEIEFIEDGEIEIERFRSDGHIDDASVLEELFALWSDEESPAESGVNQDVPTAGT